MWGLRRRKYFLPETQIQRKFSLAMRKSVGAAVGGPSTVRQLGRRGSVIAGAGKGSEL